MNTSESHFVRDCVDMVTVYTMIIFVIVLNYSIQYPKLSSVNYNNVYVDDQRQIRGTCL